MSSSSSTAESSSLSDFQLLTYEKKPVEEKNWVKIGAIVSTVVGALIAGLGLLCFFEIFPTALLGSPLGCGMTVAVGGGIALPAAYMSYRHWTLKAADNTIVDSSLKDTFGPRQSSRA